MTRLVYCRRNKREEEGLLEPPLVGKIGQEIFDNISRAAWEEWEEMQLKIINEYHLDLSEKKDRKTLQNQLKAFLHLGEDGAQAADSSTLEVGTPTEEYYNQKPVND